VAGVPVDSVPTADGGEPLAIQVRVSSQRLDEGGRAEDDLAATEDHAPAVVLDDAAFLGEVGVMAGGVLPAFDVDVGAEFSQQRCRGRGGINIDQVHHLQGGEVFGPEFLGDVGPLLALGDLVVAGQGDYEQVALATRELQVAYVAGVDDVEAAMAMDDRLAGRPGGGHLGEKLLLVDDFVRHGCFIGQSADICAERGRTQVRRGGCRGQRERRRVTARAARLSSHRLAGSGTITLSERSPSQPTAWKRAAAQGTDAVA